MNTLEKATVGIMIAVPVVMIIALVINYINYITL